CSSDLSSGLAGLRRKNRQARSRIAQSTSKITRPSTPSTSHQPPASRKSRTPGGSVSVNGASSCLSFSMTPSVVSIPKRGQDSCMRLETRSHRTIRGVLSPFSDGLLFVPLLSSYNGVPVARADQGHDSAQAGLG